jgi:hypothetical protein
MDSSILPSKSRVPGGAVALLLTLLLTWGLAVVITCKYNPYIYSYVHATAIKDRWAERLDREYGHKILIYGGSSCAFSVDGERMVTRYQLPVVNYGLAASMGATILTESVLPHCHPGDTLIVAIEPQLLCDPLTMLPDGVQYSLIMGHSEWATHPQLNVAPAHWFHVLSALRPGAKYLLSYAYKIFSNRPLLRYSIEDMNASGYQQTSVRIPMTSFAGHSPNLSVGGVALLKNLRAWCDSHHVQVAYALPWSYCPPNQENFFKKSNADWLWQVNQIVPVLKDPTLGSNTNADYFADTGWHLTSEGARLRTDHLADIIRRWDIWTGTELCAQGNPP